MRRLKLTFARNGFPIQLPLAVSTDRQTWQTVATADKLTGQPYACEFGPVTAQFVRVSALKPDGPNQLGAQMAIAELEAYE